MQIQYHLKQLVIVTKSSLHADKANDGFLKTPIGDSFFFGEVAAINDGSQLCIRRFNFNIPLGTDITELQWINLKTEDYHVTPITLPFFQQPAAIAQQA